MQGHQDNRLGLLARLTAEFDAAMYDWGDDGLVVPAPSPEALGPEHAGAVAPTPRHPVAV